MFIPYFTETILSKKKKNWQKVGGWEKRGNGHIGRRLSIERGFKAFAHCGIV